MVDFCEKRDKSSALPKQVL